MFEIQSLSSDLRVELELSLSISDRRDQVCQVIAHQRVSPNALVAAVVEKEHLIVALGLVSEIIR